MGPRARVEIRAGHKRIETIALLNTGFETSGPEVLLPKAAAERLGLMPNLPRTAREDLFDSPFGKRRLVYIPGASRIRLLIERRTGYTKCGVNISEEETEVVLSGEAVSRLRIEIIDPGKGSWRLRGEKRLRRSPPPEHWA